MKSYAKKLATAQATISFTRKLRMEPETELVEYAANLRAIVNGRFLKQVSQQFELRRRIKQYEKENDL